MSTRLVLFFVFAWATAAAAREIRIERDVPAAMRDGTILRADVYQLLTGGPYPVLVLRTPYGKHGHDFTAYAQAGYIVVCQDARGRYKSDGEFESFVRFETHDAEDGYDTVEWAAKLPNSNGLVGTLGSSYNAFLQWRLAPLRPPSLVAMAASSIPARYTDLEGPGALRPGRRLLWWHSVISPDLRKRSEGPEPHTNAEAKKRWHQGEAEKWLYSLPRLDLPNSYFGTEAEPVKFWMRNPHLDPWALDKGCRKVAVPNLDIIGWFDHCNGSIDLHREMRKNGKTKVARENQQMIIGPWNHSGRGRQKAGDVDFGPEAAMSLVQTELRWFDYWLKGKTNGVEKQAPVKIFVMGKNQWREEQEWPLKRTRNIEFFLASGGEANTPDGNGRLSRQTDFNQVSDHYVYDPSNPVPTLWNASLFTVPADQRPLGDRKDILVYQTEPLNEPLEVIGYPEVTLYAASSAQDTDFFARLIDVDPNGKSRDIAMGMVRASCRESLEKPTPLKSGKITKFVIRLRPTANEFGAGHRIRLDITSSDFPNYERNLNIAGNQNGSAEMIVADQTVYSGKKTPSSLLLPVLAR